MFMPLKMLKFIENEKKILVQLKQNITTLFKMTHWLLQPNGKVLAENSEQSILTVKQTYSL